MWARAVSRKPESSSAVEGESAGSEELRLLRALDHIIDARIDGGTFPDSALGAALHKLVAKVEVATERHLRDIAIVSIDVSEAAINVGWMRNDSREVAKSTGTIASAIEELASSTSDLAQNCEAGAAAAESTRDIMTSCNDDSRLAVQAMETIAAHVSAIGERMAVLETAVSQIGGMAGDIDAIAKQTNLLALNATIEAARAGDAGRGFSVVAAEVKALSIKTSGATQDIRSRLSTLTTEVGTIRSAVANSLQSVASGGRTVSQVGSIIDSAGGEMTSIASRIRGLSDLLTQQRAATGEIAENVTKIADKAAKMDSEVVLITERLETCEERAIAALRDNTVGSYLPAITAEAIAYKRCLSTILLGATRENPAFDVSKLMTELEKLRASGALTSNQLRDIRASAERAVAHGTSMCHAVKSRKSDEATAAYVACDEQLGRLLRALAECNAAKD